MNLETLQRTMAAAVMQPLTAHDSMAPTAGNGEPMSRIAASFIAPNARLSPFERLEIYNRQYWFRVIQALREDFIALEAVLGPQRFEKLAVAYLDANPSRSFTLRNLGSHLVEWLTANPHFAGRRHRIALDIVRIEWAQVEAFDNPAVEPLPLEAAQQLNGESLLVLQPHLQLLALDHAVDQIVIDLHHRTMTESHDRDSDALPVALPPILRRATWLAAHRVDNSVFYRRMDREEYAILSAIRSGSNLAEAIDKAFSHSRIAPAARPARISEWFANWAQLGWLSAAEDSQKGCEL